jgi:hypothetical protein
VRRRIRAVALASRLPELETVNDLHAPAIGKYRMRSALALTLMIAQAFLFNAVLVFLRTSADEVS